MTNEQLLTHELLALVGVSLTGACVFHYGGELIRRWRARRAERATVKAMLRRTMAQREKWKELLK